MAKINIKSPLLINIFWHNASEKMYSLGDILYSFFLRNSKNPLDRHLGIPVNIYPYIPTIKKLSLNRYDNSANIILVDAKMNGSPSWEAFVDKLITYSKSIGNNNHRIFPVAIDEHAHKFTKAIQQIQFINLHKEKEGRKKWFLLLRLTHEICRLIYKQKRADKAKKTASEAPIKLFLSHAKSDGLELTKSLRNHIQDIPGLNSFFDASDIVSGFQFSEELESHLEKSILVVIHTDEYSTREWCRKEILLAKKYDRPVIVVNQLNEGELRSFPYIGNVPHINVPNEKEEQEIFQVLDRIILEALREALKIKYHTLRIQCLSTIFNQKVSTILSYPPELIALVNMKKERGTVLYPDPPIGQEELQLLEKIRPEIDFITPTLLPLGSDKGKHDKKLDGVKIAVSLSEINHSQIAWIQNLAIQDLMVELTRYLMVSGGQIIYSGDINYKPLAPDGFNFSKLLIDLLKTYQYSYENSSEQALKPIENFITYPYNRLLTNEKKLPFKHLVKFIEVDPPKNLELNKSVKLAEEIKEFDTYDKKYVWAKSLSAMRLQSIGSCNALIVLGGKWINFRGKMPGILEEALTGFKLRKPIYLIGAFGGVAEEVVNALKGKQPEKMTNEYYASHYSSYEFFLQKFNEDSLTDPSERVDYKKIVKYLNTIGKDNSDYGLKNGLTQKENKRLFKSQNEIEIISLILKGLQNINQ